MIRTAHAAWKGDLKSGKGLMTAGSGAFKDLAYSFKTRFEDEPGTNPEELIAAAHAGCFTMATSSFLSNAGFTPTSLSTTASLTLEPVDGAQTVAKIHLELVGVVPDISAEQFAELAGQAKEKCPVSRLLNCEITLEATLSGS